MSSRPKRGSTRREFLRTSALAGGAALASGVAWGQASGGVIILTDPQDPVASSAPAKWATEELARALTERGVKVTRLQQIPAKPAAGLTHLVVSGPDLFSFSRLSKGIEELEISPVTLNGAPMLRVHGSDPRGLVYALLELADRVQCAESPLDGLRITKSIAEHPANPVRAMNRCFESDVEDKPWFNDKDFWRAYLTMLAYQRFNRAALSFGLGYDFTSNITDCYLHFAYPFLIEPEGYNVRAKGLPDAERDRNLEMLRFASDEAVARGLDFNLCLWTHAYEWQNSPRANYTFEGLTHENHAAYCRDALTALLKACPSISILGLRIHGESGVAEGSYDFWKTVMDGVAPAGRKIEINLHAKGLDQRMLDIALATGMPVSVAPKTWAEHMGLPYQQASIRELEKPPKNGASSRFFALSNGSRSFLRYGYGDLLTKDRKFTVYSRMFPGTQRVLLSGDPVSTAAYARAASFCGEVGMDLFEPLSFKGRRGSGVPGGRCGYGDASLNPKYDFQKFLYTYRLWGRHLYNPDTDADVWRRWLRKQFGAGATAAEASLASASRILPLVTTAYDPSAAANTYWPEMYTNQPMVEGVERRPLYGDSPSPKVFGKASSLDPELFAGVDEFANELLTRRRSGKYSPIQVAAWLEDLATAAEKNLKEAEQKVSAPKSAEFRRLDLDVAMQVGLGRFFAAKFRAGVLYAIFEQTGDKGALTHAQGWLTRARASWAELAERAKGLYANDVSYGPEANLRGHWSDRLAAIDADLGAMMMKAVDAAKAAQSGEAGPSKTQVISAAQAIAVVIGRPAAPTAHAMHQPPSSFRPGYPLTLDLEVWGDTPPDAVRLHYRHINQAEEYQVADMTANGSIFRANIPGDYSNSPYALQYFFEIRSQQAAFFPTFDPNAPSRPYFVVLQS